MAFKPLGFILKLNSITRLLYEYNCEAVRSSTLYTLTISLFNSYTLILKIVSNNVCTILRKLLVE